MKQVIVLLILTFIYGCNVKTNEKIENYRTMPFTHSPLYAVKGAKKLTKKIDSIAVYSFKTKNDRLQSITYQLNGRPKPLYENYTSSTFIFASINEFDYVENEIIVRHYDHLKKPYKNKPAISIYALDDKGRVISLEYFDTIRNPVELEGIHKYRWTYLDNNIGEVRYSKEGVLKPMNNWFPYNWVLLSFDENNNLTSITETDKNWKTNDSSVMINFTLKNHEVVKWIARDTKTDIKTTRTGSGASETRHEYSSDGYLIRTRFFDANGNRTKSNWGHSGFVREYNNQGNRLSYNFIDLNDERTTSARSYSGQKFIWDSEGHYRVLTYYTDVKDNPILRTSVGYSQIEYIYNSGGNEIGKVFKDSEDNIICSDKIESSILLRDHNGGKKKELFCK